MRRPVVCAVCFHSSRLTVNFILHGIRQTIPELPPQAGQGQPQAQAEGKGEKEESKSRCW